jgi:hypothetical protein
MPKKLLGGGYPAAKFRRPDWFPRHASIISPKKMAGLFKFKRQQRKNSDFQ